MTPEKAIEVLRDYHVASHPNEVDALHVAIQALEKQIPKKPIATHNCPSPISSTAVKLCTRYQCPVCGFEVDKNHPYYNYYCSRCGQAIDWEENK